MKTFFLILFTCTLAWAQSPKTYIRVDVANILKSPQEGAEQVTQGLLGDEVQVLERRKNWLKVFLKPQYRTAQGYPGWLHQEDITKQVATSPTSVFTSRVVKLPQVALRIKPEADAKVIQKAYLGSILETGTACENPTWVEVHVPGVKTPLYAPAQALQSASEPPPNDGRLIVATAAQLKGTPYLWGGMTCKGIDCSGFTYTAYRVNGITLPRDADQQFEVGTPVAFKDLKPGDLLFFGNSPQEITHVGMYMWEGKFIHASGSLKGVTVTKFENSKYAAIFQGARRMLGAEKTLP